MKKEKDNKTPTMFRYSANSSGFTLIELMIVIGIIGVLSGLFITQYPATQRRARDSKRMNDIRQYQTGLEAFANNHNGNYWDASGKIDSTFCNAVGLSACPVDPKSPATEYRIVSTESEYVIWAKLEDPPSSANYFVVCSTGRAGKTDTEPTGSSCPPAAVWL